MKPKQQGGARKGAGRKPAEIPSKPRLVRLDDETVEVLRKIGEGNLSLGIRLAADYFKK